MLTNPVRCANIFERYPGVAQVVARLTGGQEAAGSSPVTRTIQSVLIVTERFSVRTLFFVFTFSLTVFILLLLQVWQQAHKSPPHPYESSL